jgi:cell shape-determining protein MreD
MPKMKTVSPLGVVALAISAAAFPVAFVITVLFFGHSMHQITAAIAIFLACQLVAVALAIVARAKSDRWSKVVIAAIISALCQAAYAVFLWLRER